MKRLSILLILLGCIGNLMSQDFKNEWQEVDNLLKKKLPKSAFEKANSIFEKSIATNNQEQIVKSIFYLQNLSSQLEEVEYDSRSQKQVAFIEKNISKVSGGAKSIVQSFLASKYEQYASRNYWKINNRTDATNDNSEDLSLWSLEAIERKFISLYIESCKDVSNKDVSLSKYKNLISNSDSKYCKNLYDFLHRRAIDGLINDRHYLKEPVYKFAITDGYMRPANEFLNIDFNKNQSESKKKEVLQLFKNLVSEHISDKDPTILIDIELKRLDFVYNNLDVETKDEKYIEQLTNLFNTYKFHSESYYALLSIAQIKRNHGQQYSASQDTSNQWKLKEVLNIYNRIIRECSDHNIVNQAKNLKNSILQNIRFSIQMEKVSLPNKPLLARVDYTQMNKLYYRIYSKEVDLNNLNPRYNSQWSYFAAILKETALKSGMKSLKDMGDYQSHSTEIDLDGLDAGNYIVLFSKNKDFGPKNNIMQAIRISVSNIAYFTYDDNNENEAHLYVVERMNGNPISEAKVDIYETYWQQGKKTRFLRTDITKSEGITIPKNSVRNKNYLFVIRSNGETYYETHEQYFYYNDYQSREHTNHHYQLFLDREIYRPGQTIYFKGIAYQESNVSNPKLLPNKDIQVIFRDANYQEIAKQSFKTNAYGTFNGQFNAPTSGLLGRMTFDVNNGHQKSVRIEEYKRPSFEVVFDTFRQQAKLGDKVNVLGKGLAYSGANLPNANLKYKVLRRSHYPFWRCWWLPIPRDENQIAQGEAKTDENGEFSFSFIAEKGRDNPWDRYPIYQYEMVVEMTDVTGEMQIGTTSISIGKLDFQIQAQTKNSYKADKEISIPISVKNLNGINIDKSYSISISKLVDPSILYQTRYWGVPDMQTIEESSFRAKFPAMPYKNEDRIEEYKVLKNVLSRSAKATESKGAENFVFNTSSWTLGAYKLTVSAMDNTGKEVSIDRYFRLTSDKEVVKDKPVMITNKKETYEPGDNLNISLNTSQTSQKVWYRFIQNKQKPDNKWSLGPNTVISKRLTEEDRGGAYIHWTSVWNNRIYQGREFISIPWTNKQLDIEYLSFRDKLAPSQEEEWQIKIKGKKGDAVMAEVLANMYDQSLDVFAANTYSLFPYSNLSYNGRTFSHSFSSASAERGYHKLNQKEYLKVESKIYPSLIWTENFHGRGEGFGSHRLMKSVASPMAMEGAVAEMEESVKVVAGVVVQEDVGESLNIGGGRVAAKYGDLNGGVISTLKKPEPIKVRTNLNETVFFKPNLMTDREGNLIIKFKMNEALTKWKFMTLALTKDFRIGISEKSVVTQKDLMIQPNAPRFMRENDKVFLTARVTNLSDVKQSGWAMIELMNAETNKPVNEAFGLKNTQVFYDIPAGQTKAVEWKLDVPENISALTYRVIAKAGKFSDGEENTIPVLTDKMLVTETMPFHLRANSTKQFDFREMQEKIGSPTLSSKVFKLEYSANPVWYAIQSLPYLMEYPYECTEQIFNRYFANSLSKKIVNHYPKIQSVFESWKGTDAMKSNLSKNQSLKSALLEETPWVLAAQSEEKQRANISVLFDLHRLAKEEESAINKLHIRQSSDGSFPWFPGGPSNPYMTQYVVEGLGHLKFLGVQSYSDNQKAYIILNRGISFIDHHIVKHYEEMKKWVRKSGGSLKDDHLDAFAIHYLYTRSFFNNEVPSATQKVIDYYHEQGLKYWTNKSMYQEGMLALYYHRKGDKKVISDMMNSFRERAKVNEEKGMYWDNDYGYYWYQLPIETHSLMTEVFEYLSDNQTEKDNLKLFLLKNKQTNRWATTKATAAAIYALLGGKNDRLDIPKMPTITLGGEKLSFPKDGVEQGTGYIQQTWKDTEIKQSFSKVEVLNPNANVAWGALYWQYLEKLNNIKINKSTPLRVEKKLFIVRNSDAGEKMVEASKDNIKIGDKVRVRLTLFVEREMEFLHLKDMRASGFEPKDAISGYKWSGGLGYYQTTRDASMNFFIDKVYKGTYTIEYDLFTNLKGVYSNGITTFQSMYAPEFNSHSEGLQVEIK